MTEKTNVDSSSDDSLLHSMTGLSFSLCQSSVASVSFVFTNVCIYAYKNYTDNMQSRVGIITMLLLIILLHNFGMHEMCEVIFQFSKNILRCLLLHPATEIYHSIIWLPSEVFVCRTVN